jgi:ribosomal protein S8
MSQDIVADALNQIMNAKKREKKEVEINRISKVLINLLEMMKERGHIDFEKIDERTILIKILKINECRAIKPRYYVGRHDIDKYLRRFLPSRNFGTLVVSTSKGLMDHDDAFANKLGGSLIAYFY